MTLNDSAGGASSGKREVLSLLRRCMVEHSLCADIIDTSLEMLPSYEDAAIVEALVDILENRLRPKFSSVLRNSGVGGGGGSITRRSQRKALEAMAAGGGSFGGGTPPAGFAFGLSPVTGAAPRSLSGSLSDGGGSTPFGRSAGDDPSGGNVPLNAIDSAPHREEDLITLAAVLKRAAVSMPSSVRDGIRDALLVLLVDRNAPTLFSRHNSALLLGALMAQQFFATAPALSPTFARSSSAAAAADPFETLFDAFSRVDSGVSIAEQCTALLTILFTAVPSGTTPTTTSPTRTQKDTSNTFGGGGGAGTLLKQCPDSPYRSKLHELITSGEAYRAAYEAKTLHLNAPPTAATSVTGSSTETGSSAAASPSDAYQSVWILLDVLGPTSSGGSGGKKAPSAHVCPPPMAIGATPPTNTSSGAQQQHPQHAQGPPPSYVAASSSKGGGDANHTTKATPTAHQPLHQSGSAAAAGGGALPPPPPPPSYGLHMSQRSHGSNNTSQSSSLQGSANFSGPQQPAPPMAPPASDVSLEQHVAHQQRLVLTMSQKEEAKVRTVYINKLDPRITEGQLRDFLDLCGQVLRVRLCGELVGRTKYGFVEYTTSEAARKLIQKDRDIVGNCAIRCSLAKQPIQDVDAQMDAVLDAKRGLTRACLFGFVARAAPPSTTTTAGTKSMDVGRGGAGAVGNTALSGSGGGCLNRNAGEPNSIAT